MYSNKFENAESFYETEDQLYFNAVLTQFSHIGESASRLSEETKSKYPETEWRQTKDFRNRIVHNYAGLDIFLVFEIIRNELPVTSDRLITIVREETSIATFSLLELKEAAKSKYYKHVDFSTLLGLSS